MARKNQKYVGKELNSLNKRKNMYYEKICKKVIFDYKNGTPLRQLVYKYHINFYTLKKAILYYEEVQNVKIFRA